MAAVAQKGSAVVAEGMRASKTEVWELRGRRKGEIWWVEFRTRLQIIKWSRRRAGPSPCYWISPATRPPISLMRADGSTRMRLNRWRGKSDGEIFFFKTLPFRARHAAHVPFPSCAYKSNRRLTLLNFLCAGKRRTKRPAGSHREHCGCAVLVEIPKTRVVQDIVHGHVVK